MTKATDPLEPVPRYEFLEARKEMLQVKSDADKIHAAQDRRIDLVNSKMDDNLKDLNQRLEKNYYTKEGVQDQFKIELSDYRLIKAVLIVVGMAVLGLIFAVIQQYLINQTTRG